MPVAGQTRKQAVQVAFMPNRTQDAQNSETRRGKSTVTRVISQRTE